MFKDENNFWLSLWALLGFVIITCSALGAYSGHLEDQKLVEMVSKGADPVVAKCALDFPSERGAGSVVCLEAFKNASK